MGKFLINFEKKIDKIVKFWKILRKFWINLKKFCEADDTGKIKGEFRNGVEESVDELLKKFSEIFKKILRILDLK